MMYSYDGSKIWARGLGRWIPNPLRACWWDSTFYAGPQTIDGTVFESVTVKGWFGDPWFDGWNGIGPSPASFQMKALRGPDGAIYRPGANRSGFMVRVKVEVPEHMVKVVVYR